MPPKSSKKSKIMRKSMRKSKKNNLEDKVILGLSSLIFVVYVLLNMCYRKPIELGLFLVVCIVTYTQTKDVVISLSFGMIVSILLPKILPSNEVVLSEGFTDVEQGPEEIAASSTGINVSTGQTEPAPTVENPPSSESDTTVASGGGGIMGFDDDDDNDVNENYVDIGSSFLEAYKTLKPQQIEAMTNDTKELLSTQKSLVQAMESLTPVVSEGKKMLETFKGFFPGQDITNLEGLVGGKK